MISEEQFLLRQPAAPEKTETDPFYLSIARQLAKEAENKGLFKSYPRNVVERAAVILTGYYQDVISDAGIWHAFTDECRRLYGHPVPFFNEGDGYVDYELNPEDVRFMTWYALSMTYEERRFCSPLDAELLKGADAWFEILDSHYEEAPLPVDYRLAHELELHAEEDQEDLLKLGNWLFMHCYLMTPAYSMTLRDLAAGFDMSKEEGVMQLREALERSMSEDPTGPLALFLGEWLHLIVRGKMPREDAGNKGEHKYYTLFTKATGGKRIKYFGSYEDLNRFFIDALGWDEGEEHLPQMKGMHDYVLLVDPVKGMLVARNVARCIADPENPLYDRDYARTHAFDLLSVRGCCPGDLVKYACSNGWLPDAVFPGTENHSIVADNWDLIARCYLQQYYTGD